MKTVVRIFFLISLQFVIAVLSSCSSSEDLETAPKDEIPGVGSPASEQGENYEITYKFSDKVKILDQQRLKYLVKVEQDSVLYFKADTPDSIMPQVGDILSSRISDKLPYGLGSQVVSRTDEGDLMKVVTSSVSLDDIFEVLELKSEFKMEDLVNPKINSITDEDGNFYQVSVKDLDKVFSDMNPAFSRWQTRASIGSDKVLEIPIKTVDTKSGLFTEIKLVIGAVVTFDMSKSNGAFEYSFEPSVGIIGEFGVRASKDLKDINDEVRKLLTLLEKTRIFSACLPVAGGVIVLRPYADINADLVGKIEGKASVGFSYFAKFKCGWNQDGFFKENTSTDPNIGSIFNSFELKGRAEFGPKVTFSTGCGLYVSELGFSIDTSPSIMVGGELGVSGNSDGISVKIEDQKVTIDVSVDLTGKRNFLGIKHFEKEISLAKWNLLNLERPIFPQLISNSFNITHRDDTSARQHSMTRTESSETFDASYSLKGGLITKIMGGKPAIRVEKNGNEIYRTISQQDAFIAEQTDLSYELANLEKNVQYKAYPCIVIGDDVYDWDGKDFSYSDFLCPDENHPHAIDFGLPSGTKWACCNVGASRPEEAGGYYAWGETWTRSAYDIENYSYFNGLIRNSEGMIIAADMDYLGENIAGTSYDAATSNWGAMWQMPSVDYFKELVDNCSSEWIIQNGVGGLLFSGPNNAHLFLPGVGFKTEMNNIEHAINDKSCFYWTSTLYPGLYENYSYYLHNLPNSENKSAFGPFNRDFGMPIRAVKVK